jgi:hypothetical protein
MKKAPAKKHRTQYSIVRDMREIKWAYETSGITTKTYEKRMRDLSLELDAAVAAA